MDFPKTNAAHYNDTVVRQFSILAVVVGVVGMLAVSYTHLTLPTTPYV